MTRSRNIILVGGTNTGKSVFHTSYTSAKYENPSVHSIISICPHMGHLLVLIDTPGIIEYRNSTDYSWNGLFKDVEIIVNFGKWSLNEIHDKAPSKLPRIINAMEKEDDTMKLIIDTIQEECYQPRGFSLESLWGC